MTSFASTDELIACRYEEGRSAPIARKRLTREALAELVGEAR